MENPTTLEVGDVVQIAPDCGNPMFACCFLTVSELESWGIQGYNPLDQMEKLAGRHICASSGKNFEYAGKATWTSGIEEPA